MIAYLMIAVGRPELSKRFPSEKQKAIHYWMVYSSLLRLYLRLGQKTYHSVQSARMYVPAAQTFDSLNHEFVVEGVLQDRQRHMHRGLRRFQVLEGCSSSCSGQDGPVEIPNLGVDP